jgi:hypothetical protein
MIGCIHIRICTLVQIILLREFTFGPIGQFHLKMPDAINFTLIYQPGAVK